MNVIFINDGVHTIVLVGMSKIDTDHESDTEEEGDQTKGTTDLFLSWSGNGRWSSVIGSLVSSDHWPRILTDGSCGHLNLFMINLINLNSVTLFHWKRSYDAGLFIASCPFWGIFTSCLCTPTSILHRLELLESVANIYLKMYSITLLLLRKPLQNAAEMKRE